VLEAGTNSLTAWFAAAGCEGLHDFLADGAVELAVLEGGCDAPDVVEGDLGEGAAPLGGDTDTAQEGGDLVANANPQLEACVCELPHAVDGVGAFGLTEHILETDLKSTSLLCYYVS